MIILARSSLGTANMSSLSHYDNFILSMVDGHRSFEAIRRDSGLSEQELRNTLQAFHKEKLIYWPVFRTFDSKDLPGKSRYPIPKKLSKPTKLVHRDDTVDLSRQRYQRNQTGMYSTADIIPTSDINKLHSEQNYATDTLNTQVTKAAQLFNQAMIDHRNGKTSSARVNIKLALSFHPNNTRYIDALKQFDVAKNNQVQEGKTSSKISTDAISLYKEASVADKVGDHDQAIYLLKQAIRITQQPKFYNRLGVILATRKGDYESAQIYIEKAIELAPDNKIYEKNLHKVIALAAAKHIDIKTTTKNMTRSFLSFFGLGKKR